MCVCVCVCVCMHWWDAKAVVPQIECNVPRHIAVALIFIGHFLQKSSIISGSFAKNDLQLKASYESSPFSDIVNNTTTQVMYLCECVHMCACVCVCTCVCVCMHW